MTTREKIILSVMGVAIVAGGFIYFSSSSTTTNPQGPSSSQARLTELRELTAGISAEVGKEDLTPAQQRILDLADTPWAQDPFLGKKLVAAAGSKAGDSQNMNFYYTGFIDTGNKRLAVINGLEYEVGEVLVSGGFVVKSIASEAVILEDMEKRGKISIPYSGQIF